MDQNIQPPATKQSRKSVTLVQLNYPCLKALNLIWKPNVICFSSRWSSAKCLYHPSAAHLCSHSASALVPQVIICTACHSPLRNALCFSALGDGTITEEATVHDWINDWTCHWTLILHHDEKNISPLQFSADLIRLCVSIKSGLSSVWRLWCCDILPDL